MIDTDFAAWQDNDVDLVLSHYTATAAFLPVRHGLHRTGWGTGIPRRGGKGRACRTARRRVFRDRARRFGCTRTREPHLDGGSPTWYLHPRCGSPRLPHDRTVASGRLRGRRRVVRCNAGCDIRSGAGSEDPLEDPDDSLSEPIQQVDACCDQRDAEPPWHRKVFGLGFLLRKERRLVCHDGRRSRRRAMMRMGAPVKSVSPRSLPSRKRR